MPIYGYVCEQCGQETEVLQGINDAPLRSCPNCMGPVRKLLYPTGVIFKGTGFYTTDYKAKGAKSGSEAGAASESVPKSSPTDSSAGSSKSGATKTGD